MIKLQEPKRSVLVITNSIATSAALGIWLAELNFNAVGFHNCQNALAYLNRNKLPELVLIEGELENMSSAEFLDEYRATRKSIPVVVLSESGTFDHPNVDIVIKKPFGKAELLIALKQCLPHVVFN